MVETYQHGLPLLAAGQAQKHVTVNEALARIDAVAQLRVVSDAQAVPPAGALDGQAYVVPEGASGAWAGKAGLVALFANGGWVFLGPRAGWRAWNEAAGAAMVHDGAGWIEGALDAGAGGAATLHRVLEVDHALGQGTSVSVPGAIPSGALVIGVTGRVLAALGGAATSWRLGVPGSDDRYGSGLGKGAGSHASGLTGAPVAYYGDTDLVLSGEGGGLDGGVVRLAVHLLALRPPRAG
ncbi:DUF2793 domain-containing protein [Halovulum dunhuangense]|uniref:DUF2793 domain-containing protein n=1 Tax=Halovulum dunhuangense TaxID=1505036 RepID=A0A849L770_9RHOB|nr:DUF2793 domain-containing protein [Halovulum dunhuangense]NNU81917.1 DUF2793 domain-containing protein [Halovulum dunhuangense]